jgi:hypothetical protein
MFRSIKLENAGFWKRIIILNMFSKEVWFLRDFSN